MLRIRFRIKDGWEDAGKQGFVLGKSIRLNVMDWTPIVYDGEEDPDFIKTHAISILKLGKRRP